MLRVVVLGGGTAGWMAAAGIARRLGSAVHVTLIESEEIGIVGVGEATLPHLRAFLKGLGIDEAQFMRATDATFKLGIEFDGFGAPGDRYIHPFGTFGRELAGIGFHHFFLRSGERDIGRYALGVRACEARRFARPDDGDPAALEASYGYAYQFDATKFGPYLREKAIGWGVERVEGRVIRAAPGPAGIDALHLDDARVVGGDLFVDCSGLRSLLLGDTLDEPWDTWSHWLPCDRAVAAPCEAADDEIAPYTTAVAMPGGWRWRIPLRSRVGNGYVFASNAVSEDEATAALLSSIEGRPIADPRVLRFQAGRRRRSWVGNVVAVGLASGFLEPLESTSIYLAQVAIERLIELMPMGGIDARDRDAFNRLVDMEYDRIRDFLILHYHATRRGGTPFWDHVRTMAIPDSLADKMRLWRETARVVRYGEGLFFEPSWIAVYLGQGIIPEGYDARAAIPDGAKLTNAMAGLSREIEAHLAAMPRHGEALGALAA